MENRNTLKKGSMLKKIDNFFLIGLLFSLIGFTYAIIKLIKL